MALPLSHPELQTQTAQLGAAPCPRVPSAGDAEGRGRAHEVAAQKRPFEISIRRKGPVDVPITKTKRYRFVLTSSPCWVLLWSRSALAMDVASSLAQRVHPLTTICKDAGQKYPGG